MDKYKKKDMSGLQAHIRRDKPSVKNPDINYDKSKTNYDLCECEDMKKKAADIIDGCTTKVIKSTANWMAGFIVTSDHGFFESISKEEQEQFFKDSLAFLNRTYGSKNCLTATVHLDETTPHMHAAYVPITPDGRLSSRDLFTNFTLKQLQTDYYEEVGKKYGLERGEEQSTAKHVLEARYKVDRLREEQQSLGSSLDKATGKLISVEVDIEEKMKTARALQSKIHGLIQDSDLESRRFRRVYDSQTVALENLKEQINEKQNQQSFLESAISENKGLISLLDLRIEELTAKSAELETELKEKIGEAQKTLSATEAKKIKAEKSLEAI
jgi:hypothetical protein